MELLLLIIGVSFVVFGIVAWIAQTFSIAYIGLMGFGVVALALYWFARG